MTVELILACDHRREFPGQFEVDDTTRQVRTSQHRGAGTPAYLLRQHLLSTLSDRLSTRPFLSDIEKRWLVYLLLRAAAQCHSKGVCHGDIKSENVLVTSGNWLLLTDFAPFKPTFLPVSEGLKQSSISASGGRDEFSQLLDRSPISLRNIRYDRFRPLRMITQQMRITTSVWERRGDATLLRNDSTVCSRRAREHQWRQGVQSSRREQAPLRGRQQHQGPLL